MEIGLLAFVILILVFMLGLLALMAALGVAGFVEYNARKEAAGNKAEQQAIPPPPSLTPTISPTEARVFARPRLPTPPSPRPRLYAPPPAATTPEIPPESGTAQADDVPTEDDGADGPRRWVEDPSDGGSNVTLTEFVTPTPAREQDRLVQRIKTTRGDR